MREECTEILNKSLFRVCIKGFFNSLIIRLYISPFVVQNKKGQWLFVDSQQWRKKSFCSCWNCLTIQFAWQTQTAVNLCWLFHVTMERKIPLKCLIQNVLVGREHYQIVEGVFFKCKELIIFWRFFFSKQQQNVKEKRPLERKKRFKRRKNDLFLLMSVHYGTCLSRLYLSYFSLYFNNSWICENFGGHSFLLFIWQSKTRFLCVK